MKTVRMRKTCRLLLATLALVMVASAQPVDAQESLSATKQKQAAARQRKARIAAQLNTLRASDAQLSAAVKVLDRQVAAELARAGDARQAVLAAEAAVVQAEVRIAGTEAQLVGLRQAVVSRAVSAYIRPQEEMFATVLGTADFAEASRRTSLLAQVANHDRDVLDQLRSLRQDLGLEQTAAAQARDLAAERRMVVNTRLAELEKVRRDKKILADALDQRIREFQAEADEVARQEAGLAALIRSRERAAASVIDGVASAAGLVWPVRGTLTSGFGPRWGRLHAGIDIAAKTGTPIKAPKAGEVIFSGTYSGYGNCVIIDHGGGLTTLYGHQSRIAVREGANVGQGDVIGYVGSTGHSTGPHLHFETRVNGSPQNPRRFLP
ncbi:MAG: murein hydrolase activator EnvC family protein [Acidimicrobiales bacterium]